MKKPIDSNSFDNLSSKDQSSVLFGIKLFLLWLFSSNKFIWLVILLSNADLEANHKSALSKMTHIKTENGKKIIPVVVHIIHDGGGANLSVSQIQNGLDHLNANINGQADNFLAITPDIFASVRGDLNVEFRLAKIDPLGNPTSGIVRVQSELTVATVTETLSRDRVKALSYWNSFQYLNIWVVQSMPAGPDPQTDPALNGYAQFQLIMKFMLL